MDDIKIKRFGWAHHIKRMDEGRMPKRFLNGKFHNARSVGIL
jgi:hypothetical protein